MEIAAARPLVIIIHGMKETTLPRLAAAALRERLQVMPAAALKAYADAFDAP